MDSRCKVRGTDKDSSMLMSGHREMKKPQLCSPDADRLVGTIGHKHQAESKGGFGMSND